MVLREHHWDLLYDIYTILEGFEISLISRHTEKSDLQDLQNEQQKHIQDHANERPENRTSKLKTYKRLVRAPHKVLPK